MALSKGLTPVERSPEKAGVGGSIPSLAIIFTPFQFDPILLNFWSERSGLRNSGPAANPMHMSQAEGALCLLFHLG